jgi:hypothetical protein
MHKKLMQETLCENGGGLADIFKKNPGYSRIKWASPDHQIYPKSENIIQKSSSCLVFYQYNIILYFGFTITFDLIKKEASSFKENVCLDELYNFGVGFIIQTQLRR